MRSLTDRLRPGRLRRAIAFRWRLLMLSGLPFHLPAARASAEARDRRRWGRRQILRWWPAPLRPFVAVAMTVLWPFGAWRMARRVSALEPGWSRMALWRACLRHNLTASEVVEFDVRPGSEVPVDEWLPSFETQRTFLFLASAEALALAADKARFARFCHGAGITHPELLGAWDRAGRPAADTAADWPERVVLKPLGLSNAAGQEYWSLEDGFYRMGAAATDRAGLEARASAIAMQTGGCIAQRCLTLHADLADRGATGMPVARLITGQWPDGTVRMVGTYFVVPAPGAFASNNGVGGKMRVDIRTGELGPSVLRQVGAAPGLPMLHGLQLPGWHKAVELVEEAHRRFPARIAGLGWDVAFSDDGPVVLETNAGFVPLVVQIVNGEPAGPGPMGALLAAWRMAGDGAGS